MKSILKISIIAIMGIAFTFGMSYAGDSSSVAQQKAEAQTVIGDIGSNNEAGEDMRGFTPPGIVNYPMAPNVLFQQPGETYQTKMKVKDDILEYDEEGLTTQAQMNILESSTNDAKRVMVRSRIKVSEVTDEDRLPLDVPMLVVYEKMEGMRKIATINVLSDSKGSISDDVFARVQVEAWKLGGKVMHLKAEGFQRLVRNSSVGIGFAWTGSAISGNQVTSTSGVMGAGATWGEAGLYDHPFIIVNVLVPK